MPAPELISASVLVPSLVYACQPVAGGAGTKLAIQWSRSAIVPLKASASTPLRIPHCQNRQFVHGDGARGALGDGQASHASNRPRPASSPFQPKDRFE